MANISNAINMSFRVDKNLKKEADALFKNLGLNTSVALNMFLTQSVREQKIPFNITMLAPEPGKELQEALNEAEEIRKGNLKVKKFNDIDSLMTDLND